ncbi:hypothetical protein FUAX_48520 (plasmid) [Fulvitalea axinellae]|uniref:Rieske domain-containing protein n=1 Tax=Fulvitalea axinellae TaxID=1182444 RepID=A0AAU9DIM4_9BACT|nr:hypothetical protein FUAX_48520 [Fulvitalea axinellae]
MNKDTEQNCESCGKGKAGMNRRGFLEKLTFFLGGLSALIIGIPVLGALLEPWLTKKVPVWRSVGRVTDFELGKTVLVKFRDSETAPWEKGIGFTASWLRRDSENCFTAFAINCAHLGCPVRWDADSELFLCPCHGGVYYKNGEVAAGPPPKGLTKYKVRLSGEKVEILTGGVPITTLSDG